MSHIFMILCCSLMLLIACNKKEERLKDISESPKLLTPLDITLKPEVLSALKTFADTCNWIFRDKVFLVVSRQQFDHIALAMEPIDRYSHLNEFFPEHYLFRDSFLFLFSNGDNRLVNLNKKQYLQEAEAVIGDLLVKDMADFWNDMPQIYCPPTAKVVIEKDTVYLLLGEEANAWDIPISSIKYVVPEPR